MSHPHSIGRAVCAAAATTGLLLGLVGTASATRTQQAPTVAPEQRSDQRAEHTYIVPGDLRRGRVPRTVYTTGSTVHVGKRAIRTGLPRDLQVLGRDRRSVIVSSYDGRGSSIHRVRLDGSSRQLLQGRASGMVVSSCCGRMARIDRPGSRVRLDVHSTRTGRLLTRVPVGRGLEILGYVRNRVLVAAPGRTFWLNTVTEKRIRLADQRGYFANSAADTLVLKVRGDDGPYGFCMRYTTLSDPSTTTWYSCEHRPAAVSANGSRLLTIDLLTDGLGPRTVDLRRVDGTLVHRYRTGLFGSVGFDRQGALVLSAQSRRSATVALCDHQGDCVRSTAVRQLRRDDLSPDDALHFSLLPPEARLARR